jgi:Bacteriocin-protection, YdeI or OmpD-Associated/Domain of unknown function (DUF1905)
VQAGSIRRYDRVIARFTGTLEAGLGGGAFVVLPDPVLASLGGGSRFRVTGTLNGVDFASSTMGLGEGRVCLGVHKATREAAAAEFGQTVDVELERDTRPREVHVPEDLAAALAADAGATAAFERLSFTRRREHAESVASAKHEETRARRIAQILDQLAAPN